MDERATTWTGLLAQWMAFARTAVALPRDGDGARWRHSVPHIITLHAVALALRDLLALPLAERPVARDRSEVLVRGASAALDEIWRGEALPESIVLLRHDAGLALDETAWPGAVELEWPGPEPMVVPMLVDPDTLDADASSLEGTLCVAAPGTILMPGEPIAWWVGRSELACPGCVCREVLTPRQVYRVLDDAGRAVRDIVAPMNDDLPAGMPLLVPLLEHGRRVGRFLRDAATWETMQRAALDGGSRPGLDPGVIPVERRDERSS